jgi:hypothetical protein
MNGSITSDKYMQSALLPTRNSPLVHALPDITSQKLPNLGNALGVGGVMPGCGATLIRQGQSKW